MSDQADPQANAPRKPRVFKLDDPGLEVSAPPEPADAAPDPSAAPPSAAAPPAWGWPSGLDAERGIRWGSILIGALTSAATFALMLWFYRLVSVGLWQDDWVGWTMRILVGIAAFAALMLLLKELIGFFRLSRLKDIRADAAKAIGDRDLKAERVIVDRVRALYEKRPELAWAQARLKDHMRDVHDPGALLEIADRDLMGEIDGGARRLITTSARRVATVTALSPMALIAVGFVAIENLRLLRKLAAQYGGRPGFFASLKLARAVIMHLVATGGVALTDDLLGQFIGQDVLRRLSARLGEGAFNGALTARVGVAAIDLVRPLPVIAARPVRVRDIVAEVLQRTASKPGKADEK